MSTDPDIVDIALEHDPDRVTIVPERRDEVTTEGGLDAEQHEEEDRRFQELVQSRNQADNLVHAVEKSLSELGDQVDEAERKDIESKVEEAKQVIQGEDKEAIDAKAQELSEVSGKLAERLYGQQGQAEGEAGGAESAGGEQASSSGSDEDVVDAEFEEVDDNDEQRRNKK